MFKELSLEEKILVFLNSLGAHEESKARSAQEIALMINASLDEINPVLTALVEDGYLKKERENFYLTEKGIIKVMRSFS